MNRQQSLGGGGARGFLPLKGKNVGVEPPTYKGITSEVGWAFSPTKSKIAFTLAEALITLGIIGVVAAMTMPTLITKYQKHVAINRAKQVYSELSQVLQLARVKYGDMDSWEITSYDAATKYIVDFYKGLTVCKKPGEPQNSDCGMGMSSAAPIYATARGEGLSFSVGSSGNIFGDAIFILVDTDGGKGKNRLGTDVFYFEMKNNRLTSFAWKDDITREELKDGYYSDVFGQTFACKEDGNRHACTSLLMLDGWEMKDDYPW